MQMEKLNFSKNGIQHSPIKYWDTDSRTKVAIYQGSRGENPELDFIVKYKEDGKRLRAPSHTHWIVDIVVKSEVKKGGLLPFVMDLIKIYDETVPFTNSEQRDNYELNYPQIMGRKYGDFQECGNYSIETLVSFIELFSLCEKQTNGAFMFRNMLCLLKQYCEGKKDFYQVIAYSKRV